MKNTNHPLRTRLTALLLTLVCILGLFPSTALAAGPSTIELEKFGFYGVSYQSANLGRCLIHQMYYDYGGKTTVGFCGTKGATMNDTLRGQKWGSPRSITDPTVTMMMGYYYSHSLGKFTDVAIAAGVNDVWDAGYTWYMNAWVQAIVWRYKAGTMSDPVVACAEELMYVYNSLEGTRFTNIDQAKEGHNSFRDRAQYIFDLGKQGAWGNCTVNEYTFIGSGASNVQKIIIGDLDIVKETYQLIVKKVDSSNPSKGLQGAEFHIESSNGSYSKDVVTGPDGTCTVEKLEAGTYAVTETAPPPGGYKVDNPGPQYVVLPSGNNKTVTVTFSDTIDKPGEGSIRKVDADNPTRGLAGAVIKITGVDNSFTGTYITGEGGYLTDVPWKEMPIGSFLAEEVTPPEGYTKSPDQSKVRQSFHWDGRHDVALVFENDSTVKVRLLKLDDSSNPLPGAVFNIFRDGQLIGTEATKEDGSITVTDVTEGMYAFVEVSAPPPYAKLTEPVIAHVDQATINGGGTVTVSAADKKLPNLTILKRDAKTGDVIPNTNFEIRGIHYGYHNDVTTGADGKAVLTGLPSDSYEVTEISVPDPYVVSDEPTQTIWLEAGDDKELIFDNLPQPTLKISKVEKGTGTKIPGTVFTVEAIDGDYRQDVTTGADGTVTLRVMPGSYRVTEKSVPEPYVVSDEPTQTISLDAGDEKELIFENQKQPLLRISKIEKGTGVKISGTVFLLEAIDGDYRQNVTTGADGWAELRVAPGSYRVTEQSVPEPYVIGSERTKTISLNPGDEKEITFENLKKPELTLSKIDADSQQPIPGTVLRVEAVNGDYQDDWTTGADGMVTKYVEPGTYRVTEISVPAPYFLPDKDADRVQTVSLNAGDVKKLTFRNRKAPELTIFKEDSVAGAPIEGVKFHVTYTSNGEAAEAPATIDFGYIFTDARGEIKLHEQGKRLYPGEYTITEVAPAPGYQMKEPTTQKVIIHGNESKTVTFQNEPLNAIIVEKYDSVTGEALPGCTFQLRYLGGTSGTGGTVISQKVTGKNGTAIWTGLKAGTYVLEEVDPADGYSIINSSETVYLADSGTQSVVTVRFDNSPDGSLLIRKVCSVNPSITLANAEFKITYADGTLIGDSNGIYRTDENGEIRIPGLKPGKSIIATEVKAPPGFIIDTQSQTIQIKEGRAVTLTFKNQPTGKLIIQKRDSITGQPLPGAQFRVTTAAGCEVGLDGVIGTATMTQNGIFETDSNGEIRITNLIPGAYVLTEIKAPTGYVMDEPSKNVVIGTNGDTQTVIVTNTPKGGLIVEKYDSITKQPLAGARFKIMYSNGELLPDNEGLTSSNGLYTTDQNGQIVLSKVQPGTLVVTEDKAPDFYQKDPTPQTVVVNAGDTQTLRFYDDPLCTLTILKRDAVTHKPLAGVQFQVQYSDGHVVGPNNGLYTTGSDGTVTISGLRPNATVVVSEQKAPTGYILDQTPKNIVVRSGVANSLIFDDQPGTTLIIQKFIEGTKNEPLSGVAFKVVDGSGAAVGPDDGVYYTDEAGEIVLSGIEPGTTVKVREIKTVDGFVLNGTPQDILIKGGEVQRLTFWNKRAGTLIIEKLDSITKAPLAGAQFKVLYADGRVVDTEGGKLSSNGIYITDSNGQIKITQVTGTLVVTEEKCPDGYVMGSNDKSQTVVVHPQDTQTLRFYNDPMCSLTLTKLDSVTGKPVPNTEFTVKDGDGRVLGRYTTGKDGTVVVTGLIPNSTVVVVESKVPSNYVLDSTPHVITVRNGSNTLAGAGSGGSSGTINSGTSSGTSGGNNVVVENDPKTTLTIEKYLETETGNQPLKGVTFLVTDSSGAVVGPDNGEYTTDENGRIVISRLEPGVTITAKEIKVPEGVVLDSTPKSIEIKAGEGQTLRFVNKQAGTLVIKKLDKLTNKPLAGVEFELTYAEGGFVDAANGHLSSNGRYTTNDAGEIHISGITGTIVVKEVKCLPGYTIDPATQTQTVKVNPADTQTLTFYNVPGTTLTIQKLITGAKDKPLAGVEFLITDSSGAFVGPNNGIYRTDEYGRITLSGLKPGTVITAKETKTVDGFVLDGTPKSIEIKEGEAQTLTFWNAPVGGLELIKVSASDETKRIPGVTFEIRRMDGALVETVTTGENGRVHVDLDAGDYYAVELKAAKGFKLDSTPRYFTIRDNETTTLTVTNQPFSGLLIHKIDSVTGRGIYGVSFIVYDSNHTPIDQITTDQDGYAYLDTLEFSGKLFLRELEAEGYLVDTQTKTVYLKPGETTEITWKNTPIMGQIQIWKKSADDNPINGFPAGTPLEGAVFEIYDKANRLVDTVKSDRNGLAASKLLPLGRYVVKEAAAPAYYSVNAEPANVYLEHEGQIVQIEFRNTSVFTQVSVHKTGYAQVVPGQSIRYQFAEIANNSTVPLDNFYWRDTLPTDAVRLDKIITGTWSARLSYKVVYKTNTHSEYQTLADNLSTSRNYTLDASAAALGLASNEYVTEVTFLFGRVPAGFTQLQTPYIYCNVKSGLAHEYRFANKTDVGGIWQGNWVMSNDRWVTIIYSKKTPTPKLPRTGY